MKRVIDTVLLALVLTTATATAPAGATAADEPASKIPTQQTARTAGGIEEPASPEVEPLCPAGPTAGVGADEALPWIARPQVGQPCCASLCEQVCGVGEACLCKRCQVLGCGV